MHATVHNAGARRCDRSSSGAAVLGDPRLALAWLLNDLRERGIGLQAGDFVTTGTCMRPLAVLPGDGVQCDVGVLGRVSASFGD